jgi:hypothetical protein
VGTRLPSPCERAAADLREAEGPQPHADRLGLADALVEQREIAATGVAAGA